MAVVVMVMSGQLAVRFVPQVRPHREQRALDAQRSHEGWAKWLAPAADAAGEPPPAPSSRWLNWRPVAASPLLGED